MQLTGSEDRVFYRRWILANGWAEAAGLGTTFVLGQEVAPWLEEARDAKTILAGALAAVLLGVLLEGVLVGFAQEAVLRQRLEALRKGSWVSATATGAGLAWALGMIPSTLIALGSAGSSQAPPVEPPALVQYGLAVALGLLGRFSASLSGRFCGSTSRARAAGSERTPSPGRSGCRSYSSAWIGFHGPPLGWLWRRQSTVSADSSGSRWAPFTGGFSFG